MAGVCGRSHGRGGALGDGAEGGDHHVADGWVRALGGGLDGAEGAVERAAAEADAADLAADRRGAAGGGIPLRECALALVRSRGAECRRGEAGAELAAAGRRDRGADGAVPVPEVGAGPGGGGSGADVEGGGGGGAAVPGAPDDGGSGDSGNAIESGSRAPYGAVGRASRRLRGGFHGAVWLA